jgi:hypothetical protein
MLATQLRSASVRAWAEDKIGTQAVGGEQSWSFTQQGEGETGLQQIPHLVLQSHPGAGDQADGSQPPALFLKRRPQHCQEGDDLPVSGECRESVRDNHHQVWRAGRCRGFLRVGKSLATFVGKLPSPIGSGEELTSITRAGGEEPGRATK